MATCSARAPCWQSLRWLQQLQEAASRSATCRPAPNKGRPLEPASSLGASRRQAAQCRAKRCSVSHAVTAARRREDVNVITANPKTAGVARWIFLALWGHKAWTHGDKAAKEYVTKVRQRCLGLGEHHEERYLSLICGGMLSHEVWVALASRNLAKHGMAWHGGCMVVVLLLWPSESGAVDAQSCCTSCFLHRHQLPGPHRFLHRQQSSGPQSCPCPPSTLQPREQGRCWQGRLAKLAAIPSCTPDSTCLPGHCTPT
jgi:hypothetical protein